MAEPCIDLGHRIVCPSKNYSLILQLKRWHKPHEATVHIIFTNPTGIAWKVAILGKLNSHGTGTKLWSLPAFRSYNWPNILQRVFQEGGPSKFDSCICSPTQFVILRSYSWTYLLRYSIIFISQLTIQIIRYYFTSLCVADIVEYYHHVATS